eukprot:NODE_4448_length_661_cov_6.031046_g3799_i0.p1 GENE.NODE_4448_length_661_cov_6.031046_g3799_i0~~NODE_4448_length_661_cov_6.031046_g3799_i0.p1  ORF type:complete len:74 (-),score=0.75 NODE_4448_length_661_cov_6.031046_g3799_i0:14-235(-)
MNDGRCKFFLYIFYKHFFRSVVSVGESLGGLSREEILSWVRARGVFLFSCFLFCFRLWRGKGFCHPRPPYGPP